jgi:hypothetical protein
MILLRDEDDAPEILAWYYDGDTYRPITATYIALLLSQTH